MQSKSIEIQSILDVRAAGSQHEGAGKPQPEDRAEAAVSMEEGYNTLK